MDSSGSFMPQSESLRNFTAQVLKDAPEVGCLAHECKILVVDFNMPKGVNPVYGSALADELSRRLADSQKEVQVFNRDLLRTYAAITNPSSTLPKSADEARDFARGFGANAVAFGIATKLPDNSLKLSIHLLNVKDASVSRTEDVIVPPPPASLPQPNEITPRANPSEPSGANPNPHPSANRKFAVPGKNGVSSPTCYFMPNPPYTQEAREAKFSGVISVEGVVGVDGRVTNTFILKRVGLGLDNNIVKTMQTWKCKPANGPSGQPVATLVMFEIHFRLY
jgi:TonB family protein